MKYDAFISYSHAADGTLAPALQSGLHRLAKPWHALRALRIFRDETNLAADPGLWPSIEGALSQSRFLILMASPEAARSKWVSKELHWWLAHREAGKLLIVQSGGELVWSETGRDFDWAVTDALPHAVSGRFTDEPKHVDLRWAQREARLTLDQPAFRAAVLDLAAPIHGKDKDLLDGEDVRQLGRARLLARSAVAGLATLTVAALIAAVLAVQQRGVAQAQRAVAVEQARVALARQLAAQSALVLRQEPDRLPLAVLLALEAVGRHPSFETNQALRSALSLLPLPEWSSSHASAPERGRVRALAFSPDGAWLAAAREDGTAELVNVGARKTIAIVSHDAQPGAVIPQPGGGLSRKAPGVDAEVVALAFSRDGRLLATGSRDHTARLWDTTNGHEVARLVHDGSVVSLAFHPRWLWLATGSEDGSLRLWNLADGRLLRRLEGAEEIREVQFSPDGRRLAAIDTGACVRLIDLETRAAPPPWCRGSAGLGLAFSPDGVRLATASGDRAGVFDAASGRPLFEATHLQRLEDGQPEHFKWITQVAFSADGGWLASAGRDGTARVWDLVQGQELVRLPHRAPVHALAFSPDGRQLLTASSDGTARLWDLPSGRERLRAVHAGGSENVAFISRGDLVASGGMDGSLALWRLNSGDQPVSIRHGTLAVESVAASPDGHRLASIDNGGALKVWSVDGGLQGQMGKFFGPKKLVFGDDGRHLAILARNPPVGLVDLQAPSPAQVELPGARDADDVVANAGVIAARDRRNSHLLLWLTAGGQALPVEDDTDPWRIVIDARSQRLATWHADVRGKGAIRVRSLPTLQDVGHRIQRDHQPEFALDPGGSLLAVSGRERDAEGSPWRGYVDLFNVATGRKTLRLPDDRSLTLLRFSPDGQYLFTIGDPFGNQAQELRVWRVADGQFVARLLHENDIQGLRVSPLGDALATRTGGQIRVWQIPSGELLSQIESEAIFRDYAFSPDGRRLLTGSSDGQVTMWLWRSADLSTEACRRLNRNLDTEEWARYLGGQPYRPTCANLPPPLRAQGGTDFAVAQTPQR